MRKLTFKLLLASLMVLPLTNAFSQIWYEPFNDEDPVDWTIHQTDPDFLYWYDGKMISFRQSFTFETIMLVSPAIEIDPDGYINFDIGEYSDGPPPYDMAFGTVTDPADPSTFTELALYTPTIEWETHEFDLSNLSDPDNVVYFAWKMITDLPNYYSIDNIIVTGTVLGINEIKNSVVSVYPNPSNGNINISSRIDLGEATISIYDINGRKVFNQEVTIHDSVNVNAENLNTGLYILHVEGVDYSHTTKLLIN